MKWFVLGATVLVLTYLGQVMRVAVDAGHYWILIAVPVAAVWGGYYVGNDEDRAEYKALWRWIRGRFAGR